MEESKRKTQTEKDGRVKGRGRWAQRPWYSHFLLISLPQQFQCLPYPEHLHPLMGSLPTRRETCYCAATPWPNSQPEPYRSACVWGGQTLTETQIATWTWPQSFILELALWPLTAKQTDVSWFTEEETNQTCWRRQKLVTNIDPRTQQLHVGATESLNTASDQMRQRGGTRVGKRWLSRKTFYD